MTLTVKEEQERMLSVEEVHWRCINDNKNLFLHKCIHIYMYLNDVYTQMCVNWSLYTCMHVYGMEVIVLTEQLQQAKAVLLQKEVSDISA